MYDPEILRDNIRDRMDGTGKGVVACAKAAGISQGNLSDFLNAKVASLKVETLYALGAVFDCTIGELLGEPAKAGAGDIRLLSFDQIGPGNNPRKTFDPETIEALAADIGARGILQNLIVTQDPTGADRFMLVAGERRFRAIQHLIMGNGWTAADATIPARIVDGADAAQLLATALVENAQREDIPPLEEAAAFKCLIDIHGWETKDIAAEIGHDVRHVQYRLKLLDLGPWAASAMRDGLFPPSAGRHIARLDEKNQIAITNAIMAGDLAPSEKAVAARVEAMLEVARATDASNAQKWLGGVEQFGSLLAPADPGEIAIATSMPPSTPDDIAAAMAMPFVEDTWIRARHAADGRYIGECRSTFGAGDAPFDWPTTNNALRAAASLLASDMREISLNKDETPHNRQCARDIMDWANDCGAELGGAKITLPGDPPAEAASREWGNENDEYGDGDADATAAPPGTPPGSIVMPPKPGVTAYIYLIQRDGGRWAGGYGYQAAIDAAGKVLIEPFDTREAAIVAAAEDLVKQIEDMRRAHPFSQRGETQARHILQWANRLILDNYTGARKDPAPAGNKGLTVHQWSLADNLLKLARAGIIGDRADPTTYHAGVEIMFPSQVEADRFVDAFEEMFPPDATDQAKEE